MTTRQVQLGFLVITLTTIGVSMDLGYRFGKRNADKWWKAQPERIITKIETKIEYREGLPKTVYIAKDGENYDAVMRGWTMIVSSDGPPCINLEDGKSRVLIEGVQIMTVPKAACQFLPTNFVKGSK